MNEPLPRTSFLVTAFVLFPVVPACAETLGVFTTKEEIDLSFLLVGNVIEDTTSGALSFLRFRGNILALKSCKMWSGLKYMHKNGTGSLELHKFTNNKALTGEELVRESVVLNRFDSGSKQK